MTDQALPENGYFRLGNYYVDVGDNRVFDGLEGRHVEPKAMHVLYQLALSAGETVSRKELMERVWQGRIVIEDALTRVISQLRSIFNDSKSRQIIQTVPKKGYRLAADITWLSREDFIKQSRHKDTTPPKKPFSLQNKKMIPAILTVFVIAIIISVASFWPYFYDSTEGPVGFASTSSLQNNSIAVALLPWRNLTGDQSNNYLAEMLPEELSISLAKSDRIKVIAHHSSLNLNVDSQEFDSILSQLELAYWIEGSITQADKEIRVLVRLVERQSRKTIWSEVYKEDMQEVLKLNADIVVDITGQLFGDSPESVSVNVDTKVNIDAYRAYLQGNYWWMNGTTSEWFFRAAASFTEATELDPSFAPAYGSLAFIYARYNYHDVYMQESIAFDKARKAIKSALELDPEDINALIASSLIAIEEMNFAKAEQFLLQVLQIDPTDARGFYVYSELALAKNELDTALNFANKSLAVDPLSPWINVNKAIVHFWRNELEQALAALEQAIKIDNNYTWAYVWKAKVLNQSGNLAEAIEAMQLCLEIDDGSPLNSIYLGLLYNGTGQYELANKWFAHTASLYGDSSDARFWQSYSSIIQQKLDPEIVRQLVSQVTLRHTRFFSLTPLRKSLSLQDPDSIEETIGILLADIKRDATGDFWVNHRNQASAYAALDLLQHLNADEKVQSLVLLKAAIERFEKSIDASLRHK